MKGRRKYVRTGSERKEVKKILELEKGREEKNGESQFVQCLRKKDRRREKWREEEVKSGENQRSEERETEGRSKIRRRKGKKQ